MWILKQYSKCRKYHVVANPFLLQKNQWDSNIIVSVLARQIIGPRRDVLQYLLISCSYMKDKRWCFSTAAFNFICSFHSVMQIIFTAAASPFTLFLPSLLTFWALLHILSHKPQISSAWTHVTISCSVLHWSLHLHLWYYPL